MRFLKFQDDWATDIANFITFIRSKTGIVEEIVSR